MSKPRKKAPPGFYSGGGEPETNVSRLDAAKRSGDIDSSAWIVLPGGEGFKVQTKPGKVSIIQQPICADEQTVVLNAYEARRLSKILPAAIAAARRTERPHHE